MYSSSVFPVVLGYRQLSSFGTSMPWRLKDSVGLFIPLIIV